MDFNASNFHDLVEPATQLQSRNGSWYRNSDTLGLSWWKAIRRRRCCFFRVREVSESRCGFLLDSHNIIDFLFDDWNWGFMVRSDWICAGVAHKLIWQHTTCADLREHDKKSDWGWSGSEVFLDNLIAFKHHFVAQIRLLPSLDALLCIPDSNTESSCLLYNRILHHPYHHLSGFRWRFSFII